jgi:hypothetical protein
MTDLTPLGPPADIAQHGFGKASLLHVHDDFADDRLGKLYSTARRVASATVCALKLAQRCFSWCTFFPDAPIIGKLRGGFAALCSRSKYRVSLP